MSDRCCCGCCSLTVGSNIALVFSCIEALLGILLNAQILQLISGQEADDLLRLVININTVDDFDAFHGLVLAALGLNAFWLAFALFAITGNISQSHGRLTPWIFLTYLFSMFQLGSAVYFCIKFQCAYSEMNQFFQESVPTKTLTYLTLLCIYSGGGILLVLKIIHAHIVERRGKEIDNDYTALVMYIFSHMNRCSQVNDGMQQNLLPEAPPSYDTSCPPYLPPEIYRRANDSSGSSWSLSCETLKGIGAGQPNTAADSNNTRRNVLAPGIHRDQRVRYENLNVDSDNFSALPC